MSGHLTNRGNEVIFEGVQEYVRSLIGCSWGHLIATLDDHEPCQDQAVQIIVLHIGEREVETRLCRHHRDRIMAETTPHQWAEGEGPQ